MYENILLTSCLYDYNGPHIYCERNVKFVSNIIWVQEEPSSFLVCCDLVATLKIRVARNRNIFILRWSLQFKKGSKRTNTISCTNNWLAWEAMAKTHTESTTFRDITPCRPLKFNRRFWGTYSFHLQGIRISRIIASACYLLPHWVLGRLMLSTLKIDICFFGTKVDFRRTTSVISQKIALLITTGLRI